MNDKTTSNKKGSVLIIGGGIGGMQASLDLADSGFKVHLVQKDSSIGGIMSMLDKTFPTGDCAMCMISPKMVDVGRHMNIEVHSCSELVQLKGDAGDFTATLRQKARSVDRSKCTGCGECTRNCPVRNVIQVPPPVSLPVLEPEWERIMNQVLETYQQSSTSLIAILQDINHQLKYLPQQVLTHLSSRLAIPESQILAVATFYNAFSLIPVGRHIIEICSGTACHVKGSKRLLDRLKEELQVDAGHTTQDNRFTLRTVNCIGCCALAPAMRIDGETYGHLKVSALPKILKAHT
jgi:NADH:ubiquinone oxidoreductase subunit E/NAD-dependent dihydropyrimidine dehydrogenase PreA subunit